MVTAAQCNLSSRVCDRWWAPGLREAFVERVFSLGDVRHTHGVDVAPTGSGAKHPKPRSYTAYIPTVDRKLSSLDSASQQGLNQDLRPQAPNPGPLHPLTHKTLKPQALKTKTPNPKRPNNPRFLNMMKGTTDLSKVTVGVRFRV